MSKTKTEYEYLIFEQIPWVGKTSRWYVLNKRSRTILGNVNWYSAWRQYCFFPTVQAVYSAGCLDDIRDFIRQLKEARASQ